jgi:hypothetical protein
MKKYVVFILLTIFSLYSCNELDLSPLDQGSSENWYSSETQFEMAINDFYRLAFWYYTPTPHDHQQWSDDYTCRNNRTVFTSGTFNSETGFVKTFWNNQYKSIGRAIKVIENLERGRENGISDTKLKQYEAEARFTLASRYAYLTFAFGDIPLVKGQIDIDEAYSMSRTPKEEVIDYIYENFDFAIENLPKEYSKKMRATKGAALALKARYALYFGDYEIAAEAAEDCMELGIYSLNPDYAELFVTKNAEESIFLLPRSLENNIYETVRNAIPRTGNGGWTAVNPSWALLASYECTDGLPVDESPLFNPRNPFENRDPRCTATIVEFGTTLLGVEFDPHPDKKQVMDYNSGKMVKNNDTRANATYASFNGLNWRKGIDETWGPSTSYQMSNDFVSIRYADVLLIYAEAKTELNQIDESVISAINQVRARAYGVNENDKQQYPAIEIMSQSDLRKKIRNERRVEFAYEGLRYNDLIRWRIAGETLSRPQPGLLHPASLLREEVVNPGLWFWAYTPQIDENGIADFSELLNNNKAQVLSQGDWDDRQYLWPIPDEEIIINDNMVQNPGY